jgi:putative tricarboxylic transport membrane protein
MSNGNDTRDGPALVAIRTVDIAVALIFLGVSAVVIFDSNRLGFGWREGEGPAPGYFPFYVAVLLALASLINLVRAVTLRDAGASEAFVSKPAFSRVCQVLLPTIAYVGLIQYLGIYVASAIFIMGFMLVFGREGIIKTIGVGTGVPLALFFMFERWFLVPLPKGPLEAFLGFA